MPIPQMSLSGQIAWQAEFVVNNLQQTDYQHTENIDIDAGSYVCDCNGFVGFIQERAAPGHYALIPKESDQPRPRAFKYYEFFAGLDAEPIEGWQQIDALADAQPGDIIAWRFPDIEADHNTGHVMVLADTPQVNDSGVFAARVYDSAADPHYEDTRSDGDSGVGTGFINFQVDDNGSPVAFQFGPAEDQFTFFAIAIGRVESLSA